MRKSAISIGLFGLLSLASCDGRTANSNSVDALANKKETNEEIKATFYLPSTYGGSSPTVAIGDLNGDSRNDLVVVKQSRNGSNTDVYVLYNKGDGTYSLELPK